MVINRQRHVRVSLPMLEGFLARIARMLHLPHEAATVCLVSGAQMARWNRAYRRKAAPTDVLSFPAVATHPKNGAQRRHLNRIPDWPSSGARNGSYLGDIAIAPAVAQRNARRSKTTLEHEMRVLILHGVLHLLGYDHETDRGEMQRLESRLRRRLRLA